mmetsp:Transcript_88844/g.265053  ORF Transcript_88844/g.265053 Transcript_88844/m.265053 type:complete len:374 (+) Transcript_88844:762-1883(+)
MPEAQDHLRREVVRRAAGGVGVADDKLCKAEVGDLAVALRVQKQVLGLQVAVDDLPLVEVLEAPDHAGHVEAPMLHGPVEAHALVDGEQLAAHGRLQKEVEVLVAVEGGREPDEEGGVGHPQDALLVHHGPLLALRHDMPLGQRLQRECVPGGVALHKGHDAEAAAPQETQRLQLVPLVGAEVRAGRRLHLQGHAADPHVDPAVQRQAHGPRAEDLDRGGAGLVRLESALAEELELPRRGLAREPGHLLAVDDDGDLALVQDEEGLALLALLDDELARGVGGLHEGVGQLRLVLVGHVLHGLHPAEHGSALPELLLQPRLHEQPEVLALYGPELRGAPGLDRGRARRPEEQSELAEGTASAVLVDLLAVDDDI